MSRGYAGQVSDWDKQLDVGFSPSWVHLDRLVSGRYYFPGTLCNTAAGGTANYINTVPFYVAHPTRFDRIGVHVSTAGTAAALVRLGVYDIRNGIPNALVFDAGDVAADTTGVKTITIDQFLPRGWYALAANRNENAIQLRTVTNSINLGHATSLNITKPNNVWQMSSTYGALPATYTTTPLYEIDIGFLIGLRAA